MVRLDQRFVTIVVAVSLAVSASLALSACGRKGGLEAPPPDNGAVTRQPGAPANPDRPFVLDPLL